MPSCATAVLLLLSSCWLFTAEASQPWDTAFTGSPAAIREAARTLRPGEKSDAIILLDEHRVSIDARQREIRTEHLVFQITGQDAVDDWGTLEFRYSPWYEQRPEIRARVIPSNGEPKWLDVKTIAEAPARQFDSTLLSDDKLLQAPLPALSVGAIVEYEAITRGTAPFYAQGLAHRIYPRVGIPVERTHVAIEAAKGVKMTAVARLAPANTVRQSETKTGTLWDLDCPRRDPEEDAEYSLPSNVPASLSVYYSTGTSWNAVAAAYSQIVDTQIKGSDVRALTAAVSPDASPLDKARKITQALHERVRYTGIEFGEAAIVPHPPAEVLDHHFGDCKDKAALLIAALRSVGLEAQMALLNASFGEDVEPEMPGLGSFNHAIVYVPGLKPIWIDATAETSRAGELPSVAEGRLALIASPQTTALIRTPESVSADNRWDEVIDVEFAEDGTSLVRGKITGSGTVEASLRETYSKDGSQLKPIIEAHAKYLLGATSISSFTHSPRLDVSQPFELKFETKDAKGMASQLDNLAAAHLGRFVIARAQWDLKVEPTEDDKKKKARQHDYVMNEPFQARLLYRIKVPEGFAVKQLLPAREVKTANCVYRRASRKLPGGMFEVEYNFDTGSRVIAKSDFADVRHQMTQLETSAPDVTEFTFITSDLMSLGKWKEAIALAKKSVDAAPKSVLPRVRLARVLLSASAGAEARAEAQRATELDPKSSAAWQARAWIYQHDTFGRRFAGDWDPAASEKALRQAMEIDPKDMIPSLDLAILLEHDAHGERYSKQSRLDESIKIYREWLAKGPNPGLQNSLVSALLYSERLDELGAELKSAGSSAVIALVHQALTEGIDRAIISSQSNPDPENRALTLSSAGSTIAMMRRYPEAVQFLKAATRVSDQTEYRQRLMLFSKLKRVEDIQVAKTDPRYPVYRLFALLLGEKFSVEALRPYFSRYEKFADSADGEAKVRKSFAPVRSLIGSLLGSDALFADLIMGSMTITSEGSDEKGYVVTLSSDSSGNNEAFVVVKEDADYRILGTAGSLENVGWMVLDLLKEQKLEEARRWLDFAKEEAKTPKDETRRPAIGFVWAGIAPETRTAAIARLAAYSLIATYSSSPEALAALKAGAAKPPLYVERGELNLALCEGLKKAKQWQVLIEATHALEKKRDYATYAREFFAAAYAGTGNWEQVRDDAETRLVSDKMDREALQRATEASLHLRYYSAAEGYLKRIKGAMGGLLEQDRELSSWLAIITAKPDVLNGEIRDDLNRLNIQAAGAFYTTALQAARKGQSEEALRYFSLGLSHDDFQLLDARPWLVHAAILRSLGLIEPAAQEQERGMKTPLDEQASLWSFWREIAPKGEPDATPAVPPAETARPKSSAAAANPLKVKMIVVKPKAVGQ